MPKTAFQGRLSHRVRGLSTLLGVTGKVLVRRAFGQPLVREWPATFEMATLFWRAQFNHAFSLSTLSEARAYFDAVYTLPDTPPQVDVRPSSADEPKGEWYIPKHVKGDATVLYFHGGGYTFYAKVSRLFIALLANWLGVRIFAPDYRLTPEHPHPAQQEDGLAAYRHLLAQGVAPEKLVICGDSAGGHLTLMTLTELKKAGLPQPALAIALSPWTDTGRRGASQFGNDVYDMVQGYMTLQFAEWLKGGQAYDDQALSPMHQDFRGVAPIYMQAGGKEILVDMIRDFARTVTQQGGKVRLDVWPHMTHEFHAYGDLIPESRQALDHLRRAIDAAMQGWRPGALPTLEQTEVDALHV